MNNDVRDRALQRKCCKTIREWSPGKFMFCGQEGWAHRGPNGEVGSFCRRHVPDGWEESPWDSQFESELLVDWVHDL